MKSSQLAIISVQGFPEVAPLRHAEEHQKCPLIGLDRKGPAHGQSEAIVPELTRTAAAHQGPGELCQRAAGS
jgi:hypothetical protein